MVGSAAQLTTFSAAKQRIDAAGIFPYPNHVFCVFLASCLRFERTLFFGHVSSQVLISTTRAIIFGCHYLIELYMARVAHFISVTALNMFTSQERRFRQALTLPLYFATMPNHSILCLQWHGGGPVYDSFRRDINPSLQSTQSREFGKAVLQG